MSHTPGPWIVQTHYGNVRLRDDVSDSNMSVVLPEGCSYPEDIICEVWGTEHNDEANARLIAAAPELAAALRSCEYEIFACLRDDSVKANGDVLSALQTAYDAARAALSRLSDKGEA